MWFKICFQPWECNKVAHDVTRFILNENEAMYCIAIGPEWLMESIKIESGSCNIF